MIVGYYINGCFFQSQNTLFNGYKLPAIYSNLMVYLSIRRKFHHLKPIIPALSSHISFSHRQGKKLLEEV